MIPPLSVIRQVGRAIGDYAMIRLGDRLLLGVSGGKDSLSLLQVLLHLRTKAPLGAATVDPQIDNFDPSALKAYVPGFGTPYHYRSQEIMRRPQQTLRGHSFCAYCARMRRGVLYPPRGNMDTT